EEGNLEQTVYSILTREEELAIFQYSDEEIKRKIDMLKENNKNAKQSTKKVIPDYKLKDGLLYKMVKDSDVRDLFVVPRQMRKMIAIKYQDLMGHSGVDRTLAKIKTYYYFTNMRAYIKRHINQCVECIMSKPVTGRQPGELHPIPPARRPFALVHMDHLGPFVTIRRGNQYILILCDNLTRFVSLQAVRTTKTEPNRGGKQYILVLCDNLTRFVSSQAVRTTKTEPNVKKIEVFIQRFGAPERVVTDRGTCFTSKKFENFCNEYGIRHTLNSSRHPQANGLVERVNAIILPILRTAVSQPENEVKWDEHLQDIERDLNTSVNKTTGKTAFQLLYGYIPRFKDGNTRSLTISNETYTYPQFLRERRVRETDGDRTTKVQNTL
ncbi:Integrase core domain, partial [Popillia japonica]